MLNNHEKLAAKFGWDSNTTENRANRIRNPGEWGDEFEIYAFEQISGRYCL
jgi:hypothetical protein